MHSVTNRLNVVFTFFSTTAAVLCCVVALTDVFHQSDPPVTIELNEVKRFNTLRGKHDQAVLSVRLQADLRSAFSWNTKQLFVYLQAEYSTPGNEINQVRGCPGRPGCAINGGVVHGRRSGPGRCCAGNPAAHARPQVSIWDTIIQREEDAVIDVKSLRQEYPLLDQGKNLRSLPMNLTLCWNVMPRVGYLHTHSKSVDVGRMPDEYL